MFPSGLGSPHIYPPHQPSQPGYTPLTGQHPHQQAAHSAQDAHLDADQEMPARVQARNQYVVKELRVETYVEACLMDRFRRLMLSSTPDQVVELGYRKYLSNMQPQISRLGEGFEDFLKKKWEALAFDEQYKCGRNVLIDQAKGELRKESRFTLCDGDIANVKKMCVELEVQRQEEFHTREQITAMIGNRLHCSLKFNGNEEAIDAHVRHLIWNDYSDVEKREAWLREDSETLARQMLENKREPFSEESVQNIVKERRKDLLQVAADEWATKEGYVAKYYVGTSQLGGEIYRPKWQDAFSDTPMGRMHLFRLHLTQQAQGKWDNLEEYYGRKFDAEQGRLMEPESRVG